MNNRPIGIIMRYMDTETGRHSFHRIILPAAFILSAVLLLCAARRLDGFAQWYSVTIYPLIVGSVGRLFGLLPFSLSEILCSVLPLLIIADAVRLMFQASRRGDRKLTAVKIFLQHVFTLASVLLLLYAANCGVNYYREPFVPAEKLESSRREKLSGRKLFTRWRNSVKPTRNFAALIRLRSISPICRAYFL